MLKRQSDYENRDRYQEQHFTRGQWQAAKRKHHARNYRVAALAGGGKREVARRARQIAAGSLRVENGLAL